MTMFYEFEYFWAILLLFILERICYLQERFDYDISNLPDAVSHASLITDIDDVHNRE